MTGTFDHTALKPFSYGTHAAHVAVDPRTGQVKLIDFIAIEDIGRVLNPLIVHGQALGAVMQGLGGTFMEHLRYDEHGQLLTASLADYLMPTAADFPAIRGEFMDLAPAPGNPLGVKGAGEGGIVAVAAAVTNAVSAALSSFGVQVLILPISPPSVWELIRNSQNFERLPIKCERRRMMKSAFPSPHAVVALLFAILILPAQANHRLSKSAGANPGRVRAGRHHRSAGAHHRRRVAVDVEHDGGGGELARRGRDRRHHGPA